MEDPINNYDNDYLEKHTIEPEEEEKKQINPPPQTIRCKPRTFTFRNGEAFHNIGTDLREAIDLYGRCKNDISFKDFYDVEDPIIWYDNKEELCIGFDEFLDELKEVEDEELKANIINNSYYKYMKFMYVICKKYIK